MKKLISFISLAAVVLLGFTSCEKEPKPKFTTNLNTGHQYVGRLYGMDDFVDEPNDAQGIVFAVSPKGDTAYLVAFTDLMVQRNLVYFDSFGGTGLHREYTFYANPMAWSEKLFETGATNKDGEVNTDRIIKIATDSSYGATAAKACREYFKRSYSDTVKQTDYNRDTKWESTKGKWYLPSMQELAALMKVMDRINQKYLQGAPASDAANKIYFQAIGNKSNLDIEGKDAFFAYWSSTECTSPAKDTAHNFSKKYA
ncbi:MAG: hypothetical protein K2I83_03385, partial [Bacteroidales bacterium]|nr:hypothetical protein [Bacteroidales bacterium]